MEAQEAIKKIRLALGMDMPTQEFKEAKLADGVTIVTWEGELEGAELMVVSEEGKIPAPDGEHTLESGEVVTVAEGKVTSVTPAKEVEDEVEVEVELEKTEDYDMASINTMLKECMSKIEMLEKKMGESSVEAKVDEAMIAIDSHKEAFTQLVELVDRIAKLPSDEPADKGDLFSSMKVSKEHQENKLNDFAEALKNLKNK